MNILLIGESCVDQYVFGRCDRVCPEAAAMCFKSDNNEASNAGMAANVATNIKTLQPDYVVDLITNTTPIIKRRFVDTRYNSIVFRQDIYDQCDPIDIDTIPKKEYDAIVLSDYCKGFLSEQDIKYILTNISNRAVSFIDTKKKINNFVNGCHFLKINQTEFDHNVLDLSYIRSICSNIIVTQGAKGALHITKDSEKNYPTPNIDVRDVCGAGDTFLAGLVVKYLETKNISISIEYANACAGRVVSKFGVCTP
jgi:D-beta-D-heptose 7-phosphate kinase/D-beta-D-heptose 1-phosphate adenosyltransferase